MKYLNNSIYPKIKPRASLPTTLRTPAISVTGGVCPTLLSRDYKDPKVVKCKVVIKQIADLQHYGNDQMNRVYSPDGLCPTLKTVSGGDVR